MNNLRCVNVYWRDVVSKIDALQKAKASEIRRSGHKRSWRLSNFLRLRSTMVPKHSIIRTAYLHIYKIVNDIHLHMPSGDLVGIIDADNVVHMSPRLWSGLFDALLLVFDSLPPIITLGTFCRHCPFCGKTNWTVCSCDFRWATWFNSLLPRRIHISASIACESEDLSEFCDSHVLVDDCNNRNRNHERQNWV